MLLWAGKFATSKIEHSFKTVWNKHLLGHHFFAGDGTHIFNTMTNNHLLGIKAISSWEYPGHFSQSYSNFLTQNETWKQTENLTRNEGLFISFILNALKTNLVCEITLRFLTNRLAPRFSFLFKIHVGERISFSHIWSCWIQWEADFFGKNSWVVYWFWLRKRFVRDAEAKFHAR